MSLRSHRVHGRPARQRGIALVVGLILLLVLTLLAVAGMSAATMDLQMAANTQNTNDAFQAAERAVDVAMATTLPNTTQAAIAVAAVAVPDTNSSYEYTIRFNNDNGVTEVPSGGFSLGEGVGFKAYHFDVTATGTAARDAEITNTQSYYVVGPGG